MNLVISRVKTVEGVVLKNHVLVSLTLLPSPYFTQNLTVGTRTRLTDYTFKISEVRQARPVLIAVHKQHRKSLQVQMVDIQ